MKIYFPIHLDGGNRGCEAIAKGTAEILGLPKEQLIGLCRNIELDKRLKVDDYVTLWNQKSHLKDFYNRLIRKCMSIMGVAPSKIKDMAYHQHYGIFLDQIMQNDILFSTGGDMMCYDDNEVVYTNNYLHKKGIKTILWGCSIGKNNLTPAKIETLRKFSFIYARESLTADMLHRELGLTNVVTFPDPAFILKPQKCFLPPCFEKDVIGLNLSNFVVNSDDLSTGFGAEVNKLINYILNHANLNILLIPHVLWKGQDDREISNVILRKYNSSRISVLNSDTLNYCELRYVISKCRFFIGARTHAVISAYSTYVPTIALGYSIKSKGIAKDLELNECLVINSKQVKENAVLSSFKYLSQNEERIRRHLEKMIPDYIGKLHGIVEMLNL